MNETKQILTDEIQSEIGWIASLQNLGTEDYTKAVEGVAKLIDRQYKMEELEHEKRKIEIEKETSDKKLAQEREAAVMKMELEKELTEMKLKHDKELADMKMEQEREENARKLKSENIDRAVKNAVGFVGTVGTIAVTVWGTCKYLKFEETGTVTSVIGRNFVNKLFHK